MRMNSSAVTLRPDYTGSAARSSEARAISIARGLLAYARAGDLWQARDEVKDDRDALALLQRTASTPAASTNLTAFNQGVVDATVDILGPANAASAIFSRSIKVSFGHDASVWVPGVAAASTHVGFVGKLNPLRVLQYDVSKGCTLEAGLKLGFSIVCTNELLARSNAVPFLRQKMLEDIGQGLDAILLDTSNATAGLRPAGLLYNAPTVNASTATAAEDALAADLGALAAAVGGIGGEIIYVGNIEETTRIKARLPFFSNVFASSAVSAGNLIAIAPRGIAVAGSDTGPRIDVSGETTIVLDDALVAQTLSTAGTPNTIMAPAASTFQSDTSAIKMLLPDLVWAQRVTAGSGGCVAALSGTLKW